MSNCKSEAENAQDMPRTSYPENTLSKTAEDLVRRTQKTTHSPGQADVGSKRLHCIRFKHQIYEKSLLNNDT